MNRIGNQLHKIRLLSSTRTLLLRRGIARTTSHRLCLSGVQALTSPTTPYRLFGTGTGTITMGDNSEEAPFPLTEVDKWVLSQTDEEFKYHDWEDMCRIIGENNLSVLKRKPSDLRRYMKWTAETKAEYGSMSQYLLVHRLPKAWGSPPFVPRSTIPFADASDYRVLMNDWPYGMTRDITHIVVWSRTLIETDTGTGDMTPESRQIIEAFVKRFFVDRLGAGGEDRVLWFKNWMALQSVRSLEHIHVMVKDATKDVLEEWTRELDCHRILETTQK